MLAWCYHFDEHYIYLCEPMRQMNNIQYESHIKAYYEDKKFEESFLEDLSEEERMQLDCHQLVKPNNSQSGRASSENCRQKRKARDIRSDQAIDYFYKRVLHPMNYP